MGTLNISMDDTTYQIQFVSDNPYDLFRQLRTYPDAEQLREFLEDMGIEAGLIDQTFAALQHHGVGFIPVPDAYQGYFLPLGGRP
jgi:hypothetical protein